MVIPLSFSRSLESIALSPAKEVPQNSSSLSIKVVLPKNIGICSLSELEYDIQNESPPH